MRRTTSSSAQRFIARLLVIALFNQWTLTAAAAGQSQDAEDAAPLPLASTVTAIPNGQTTTFTDASLIGKDDSELVGKWIRVFTDERPAGLIIQITAFDGDTGTITLADPLPAGVVSVNDAYQLADNRDVLLPTNVDPKSIGLGSIGCAPKGSNQADTITCFAIDATGVTAQKGNDTVSVAPRSIVLVTKFGADKDEGGSKEKKAEATAIDLGEGDDRVVNDGTIVSAAITVASETPKTPSDKQQSKEPKKEETAIAVKGESTAVGIDAGSGRNIITNNGTVSTSATTLLLARQLPGESKEQKSADVSSTADATSTAIQSGDDGAFITNTGRLVSRAIAVAAGVGITTSPQDPSSHEPGAAAPKQDADANNFTFKGDVKATTTASGIETGSGSDIVTNTGEIIVTASSNTVDAGAAQIQAQGKATVSATTESTSTAQGLALGDGNDTLINSGTLTVSATSRALSLELAIADKNNTAKDPAKQETEKKELSSTVDGSATAKAEATGITADPSEAESGGEPIFKLGSGNLTVGRETTETRTGGNDSVNNSGTIDVTATSRAIAGAGAITMDGNASVKITSEATASATAADLGTGNDSLINSGTITALADSAATAVGVTVAQKATTPTSPPSTGGGSTTAKKPADDQSAEAIKASVEGSATATSTAVGITADGALSTTNTKWVATASLDKSLEFSLEKVTTQASGTDTVTNNGTVSALATATTRAATASISADAEASIKATSTAEATARAIDLGAGNDTLTNNADGRLISNATATANALSLAIGLKSDPKSTTELESAATVETKATATATGVSADGEPDSSLTIKLSASTSQLSLEIAKTTTLVSGDDTVTNNGGITSTATATTGALGVAVTTGGKSTVDATAGAVAESSAIDLGRGNDTATNTGTLTVVANSDANALGISVGVKSESKPPATPPSGGTPPSDAAKKPAEPEPPALDSAAKASAESTATAVGISADSVSAETSRQLQLQIGGGPSFLTLGDSATRPGGNDTVTNSGTVDAAANARAGALAVTLTTDGKSAAKVKSTAEASAAGIDLGGGNDTLTSTAGTVTATATSLAQALAAAIGVKSDQNEKSTAESTVDASVSAEARAVGISADAINPDSTRNLTIQHLEGVLSIDALRSSIRPSGDDTVSNAAVVTSRATATSRELAVGVTIDGKASVKTESIATADAAGIDLGGGNDTLLSNTGTLTVTSDATARALAISLGLQTSTGGSTTEKPKATAGAGGATANASVNAEATAIGISADSLNADKTETGSLVFRGLQPELHLERSQARASGNDTLTNDGAITATATSVSQAIAAGAGVGGNATMKTASTANANAAGIDLGAGNDTLTNNGEVKATSSATAEALNFSLVATSESSSETKPKRATSSVDANATAEARATGLSGDSTQSDGLLKLDLAVGNSLDQGVVFGFLKSDTRPGGNDTITNTGAVEANATATSVAAGIGLNAEGVAKARTTSTAEAAATAIDLGVGADTLTNEGQLKSFATSIAAGLAGVITNKGRAGSFEGFFAASEGLWKGGIESTATAIGIDGSGAADKSTSVNVELSGDIGVDARFVKREDGVSADLSDTITNKGSLDVAATALAGSVNVSVTAEGMAMAMSDLESNALATGVRGGQGDDTIQNLGFDRITFVNANALTGGATVAVSGKGRAISADTLWSTGTNAEATAIGVDGDGGIFKLKNIVFLGTQLNIEKIEASGIGNDSITNEQLITTLATATAPSLGISYSAQEGVAASLSSVETTSAATGIRGGGGSDIVTNFGMLFVGASSLSAAANIAIAKDRGALAGGAIWEGGTKAESTAIGIDADGVSTSTKTTVVTVSETGVSIVHEKKDDTVTGAGNDTVRNFAAITVGARAESDTLAIAATVKGVSAALGQSTSEATAAAIRGGAGDDVITNAGALNANATSIARAANVSIETTGGLAIAGNNVFNGGTTADAKATGIAGDGGSTKTATTTVAIGGGDNIADHVKTDIAAAGNDTITNTATIDVQADSTAPAASVAVPIKGMGVALSTTTAEATAAAIDAGGGTDIITNSGELKSTANATAATANVAVTNTGLAVAADAVWKGGTTATATAKGIDGGDGQSTVTNQGAIEANANSTALSGSVAVAITGVAGATATSTSTANATGIALGHSDTSEALDTLTNTGAINANALALAAAASVSVTNLGGAISADSVWNGGTTATAIARGIADSGGPEIVLNGGRIEVGATAGTGSATVAVAVTGVAAAIGTATGNANASAIDLGDGGGDLLINRGRLIADALALAGTVDVAVTTAGVAGAGNDVWNGGTKAEAIVKTISTGNGNDVVENAGDVNANSDAVTVAVPVSVAVSGVGVAIGTSTATSSATAIDGGDGDNTIVNRNAGITDRTGTLVADATAHAVTATVAVTTAGIAGASDAVWDGGTKADAIARGLKTSFGGNDTIDNGGAIEATSTARSGSGSVAVAVTGVAVALANSTAVSNAAAIDTGAPPDGNSPGADNDTVANRGALTVNSNAFALSLPVSVTTAGLAVAATSVWDGGTTADAKATGIATRAGDDLIGNNARIAADADATSGSIGVSVAVTGVAAAIATSTAKAEASAIDAGAGADRITNTGKLTGDTQALAGTVTVGVTTAGVAVAGDAVWDGGTKAEASTKTLSAGDGNDRVRNVGDVGALAIADTASVAVSVAVAGVGASVATSTATSNATAIELGAGDDTVVNMNGGQTDRTGKLTADARANAIAANVSVAPAGVAIASDAVWRGGTTATANAAAIDGGLGKDTVVNSSEVDVDASAFTHSLSAAVTVFGVSAALATSTANVSGAGIKTGDDVRTDAGTPIDMDLLTEQDVVFNEGRLVVDVESLATSLGIGFSFGGMTAAADNLWNGGTTSNAWARGIGLGNGADTLTNGGDIDISSLARALSADFGVTVFGVSAAASTATANARSSAIDGGDGHDVVDNLAGTTLTSDATAIGRGTSVSFVGIGATVAGDTVWNGGTKADALARGIDGGLGNDDLTNDGTIQAKGDSTTSSVSIAITGIGVGGAAATSTSTGAARAIDGGDGNDNITSRGNATATAISNATGVAVQATGIGAGAAFDSFNGGTQAIADATGLAGGAGNDTVTLAEKKVTADASSNASSTSVSVTLVGVAGGAASATSTANATGIDGGAGVDTIASNSEIVSTANATATGTTVVVSTFGSVAGAFDSSTRSESNAVGVAGGDGNDTITSTDKAKTTLTSNATTTDTTVAVTIAGFGVSDSQAVSTARGTGVSGGAGNDTITNEGTMTGTLTADSNSRAVNINIVGTLSSTDASGRAQIAGSGIDGGTGDDAIVNRSEINLTGTAIGRGNGVSVVGSGPSITNAVTNSDAALTGVQGGDGADTVTNAIGGNVTADATAQAIASTRSISLIASGLSNTQMTPTATATGLDGGAADDTVANNATVTANATATSSASNFTFQLAGGAAMSAGAVVTANATGLAGGDGHDTVLNRGVLTATGNSTASVTNSSWSLSGQAGDSSLFTAGGLVAGITGGTGADRLLNDGFVTVGFRSSLTADSQGRNIFGGAASNTQLTAGGSAVGIAGGTDDDLIHNAGIIDVTATAEVGATKAVVSFATGSIPPSDALLKATADATGLGGGSGNDRIRNSGEIVVLAEGKSTVTGSAEATVIGSARTAGLGTANATARGIQIEDGTNSVANIGVVDVLARGDAVTTNASNAGLVFSTGIAEADGRSTVQAFGITAGSGSNSITNNLDLIVKADASAYANAYASGSHISINGAATTHADARATATAIGVTAGNGVNSIVNRGLMEVLALAGPTKNIRLQDEFCSTEIVTTQEPELDENMQPVLDEMGNPVMKTVEKEVRRCVTNPDPPTISSPTYAAANGNGLDGDGTATAVAIATGAADGVKVGDGANTIVNLGEMNVTARPIARSIAFADGDFFAEAFGTATGTATATATGIRAGNGNNQIVNAGTLTVRAEPGVEANVDVTTSEPVCVNFFFGTWCTKDGGIGSATANATFNATAIGVQVGTGDNLIVNDGLLSVSAAPATADPIAFVHFDNSSESTTVTSSAIGIRTGNGNNTVVNGATGMIDVEADDTPACVTGCSRSFSALGIQTGSGHDTIVNDGTISVAARGAAISTAIDAGAGNDRVELGAGSHTGGNVLLGTGDDRLVWGAGASITGTVMPGSGTNIFALGGNTNGTLNLSGSGPIGGMNIFSSFNGFRKEGPATWTLTGARTMNWTVEGGTLALSGTLTGTIATEASAFTNPTVQVNTTGVLGSVGTAPAVRLQTNGVLLNQGHILAQGLAIDATGGTGSTVLNEGTIVSATGLAIQGGSGSDSVANAGTITGGAGLAIDLGAGDDSLTIFDSSIINGVSNGGAGTDQVILGGPTGVVDLTNFATNFINFEGTIQQSGFWTLMGDGAINLTVNQGLLNVVSDVNGTLDASGKGAGLIFVDSFGSVTSGDKKPAVELGGTSALLNGGIIDGQVTASGGGSSVLNFGVINNASGIAVAGGDGPQQVENHGHIVGGTGKAIDLGAGDDILKLSTTARVSGTAQGGSGFDTLTLSGDGGVRVDLRTFDSFEMLRKEDTGLWLVTGSNDMALDVQSGTLVLGGALSGAGSVQADGLLAGNGVVGSLNNAGVVSPGMLIGSMHVLGDYVQTNTGVLQVEGSILSGFNDRLDVAGTASLGGTLEIVPELRPFGIATEYTVLEAQGGVTGTFASAAATAPHLDTYVDYLPKSVTVALVRNDISFEGMSGNGNLQALGQSLDSSKRSMAYGDFKSVMDEFLTMDPEAQASALKALSGELHVSLPTTLLRTGERFLSASATRRLNADAHSGERFTMWTDYLRFSGDVRSHVQLTGSTYGASGLVAGADVALAGGARLGGSFGYARGTNTLTGAVADGARVISRMPAVYGEYAAGPVRVEGAFGYAEHSVRTIRQIAVGATRRQALADYTADQLSGQVRVSVAVPVPGRLAVAPFVETRHSQVTRRAFRETGADSVNLTDVSPFRTTSLRTLVGVRTTSARQLFGARVEPALSLAWTRAGQDLRSGMQAALSGMTTRPGFTAFRLNGISDSRSGALVDGGFSVVIANHGRAFVAYDGLLTDARTEHSVAAGLRMVW